MLEFIYTDGYESAMHRRTELLDAANELLCSIRRAKSLSDLEKALLVHDALAATCEYGMDNDTGDIRFTAYGALVNRKAVCQGYAEAYAYLMTQLGITCGLCRSDILNHAWNIIEIDGEEYHVDVTWDDPVYDVSGRSRHVNFLRSTEGLISTGHGGGDTGIMKDVLSLLRGETPSSSVCDVRVSYENHLTGFAAEESRVTNQIIRMEEYEANL